MHVFLQLVNYALLSKRFWIGVKVRPLQIFWSNDFLQLSVNLKSK